MLKSAGAARLSYEAIGETAGLALPAGFHHDRHEVIIGGTSGFDRAKQGLSRWQAHIGAGATVYPDGELAEGATFLVVLALGPMQVIAPCRIVYIVDDQDRFGLAYGTLPGHPECGEESFVVERVSDTTVFRITAFSKPAGLVTRLGAPVARGLQLRFIDKY
ncbi:MAG: DUF1990 family protein, partial [Acidimicrobiales bacterium]